MEKNHEDNRGKVLDQKLRDFEARINPVKSETSQNGAEENKSALTFVFRAGIEMVSAFILGILIGYGLDYWLSTRPLFIIIFSVLGMAAGIFNIWHLVKPDDIRLK